MWRMPECGEFRKRGRERVRCGEMPEIGAKSENKFNFATPGGHVHGHVYGIRYIAASDTGTGTGTGFSLQSPHRYTRAIRHTRAMSEIPFNRFDYDKKSKKE